jgi:carbonic anhydrase
LREDIKEANDAYAAGFGDGHLARRPARRLAVLTCIDARMDPHRFLGLAPGDAVIVRNAGALATDDALRTLAVAHWLLGVEELLVVGHTDCGLHGADNAEISAQIRAGGGDPGDVDFLPFGDLEQRVAASVARIRESRLFPPSFVVGGYVYEVRSGRLRALDD